MFYIYIYFTQFDGMFAMFEYDTTPLRPGFEDGPLIKRPVSLVTFIGFILTKSFNNFNMKVSAIAGV